MIKVVHIQTDTLSTGRAALRLHTAFLNSGIKSSITTLTYNKNNDLTIRQTNKYSKIISWIDSRLQSFLSRNNILKFGPFSLPLLGTNISRIKEIKNADYIYIHWALGGFLNVRNVEQLAKLGKPLIFFMHDMWTFTGGCHHSFTCEKYRSKCVDCQILGKSFINDLMPFQFKSKFRLYEKFDNLYFISPSKWLYNCAKESAMLKSKEIFYIPNYLDKRVFKPTDKRTARKILNINPDDNVIAFGAISINSPYKGWSYLVKALELLKAEECYNNITILIFGSGYVKEIADSIPFATKFMGHLNDEYSTVLVYNSANVFIAPSLADNLPTTILESLSCGTPVVGFDVGGIPDMISHKENGYLAKYLDTNDLVEGIKFCLNKNIQGYNLAPFEPESILKKHFQLFKHIES